MTQTLRSGASSPRKHILLFGDIRDTLKHCITTKNVYVSVGSMKKWWYNLSLNGLFITQQLWKGEIAKVMGQASKAKGPVLGGRRYCYEKSMKRGRITLIWTTKITIAQTGKIRSDPTQYVFKIQSSTVSTQMGPDPNAFSSQNPLNKVAHLATNLMLWSDKEAKMWQLPCQVFYWHVSLLTEDALICIRPMYTGL